MLSVHLNDLIFFAYHGVFEGEARIGNNFQVTLTVTYDESKFNLTNIDTIVNYQTLYDIVRKRMAIPSPLLEQVAENIVSKIWHQYSLVDEITLSIYKLQPPIEGFQGKVGVTLQKRYKNE